LAILEGAEAAVLYATGMAAVSGLLLTKLSAGDELIMFDELYQRTRELCENELSRFGIVTRFVPTGDFDQLEAAISPATRLLFCESPTNPHLSVIDLERFAAMGRKHGIETAVDATLATPYNVRPIQYGIDYVLHSCTKYLAGHNDVLAGSVAASQEKIEPLRKFRGYAGMTNAPHAEYLLLRGLKTFELRMQRHNANGQAVAEYLAAHPRVERVYYPGLAGHPNYEIARRTMRGCGGVVTFNVKDADWQETARVVDSLRLPQIAASLGGVESLVEQPLILSYYEFTPEQRRTLGIPDNMIRFACGIENTEDLLADLAQALRA
jgi:cystathionine gamma-synthase